METIPNHVNDSFEWLQAQVDNVSKVRLPVMLGEKIKEFNEKKKQRELD